MKKIIITITILSFMNLIGCYSFKEIEITNDSNYKQLEENDIQIFLKNGTEIYSKAYYHTFNNDSTDIIIGRGSIYSNTKKESRRFGGRILKSEIDSMRLDKNYLYIWLRNKDKVTFEQNNYMVVQADSAKGLLLTESDHLNKISFESINSIEVSEYNSTLTVLTIVGAVIIVIGIIAAASFPVMGSLGGI